MQGATQQKQEEKQHDTALQEVVARYAVSVTDAVLETMDPANPEDPVARQYLPDVRELETTPDELADPIGDERHSPVKGIVHRYPDRVLLKPVHVCAVYCRFCFRREMVGPGNEMLDPAALGAALDYIRNTPAIWEVILTGGDPFVLSPRRLKEIMAALNAIDHVKVIRFHSRVPVADPARISDELVEALQSEKAVYVVVHANHANELTDKVRSATMKLIRGGIPLLSQSTLLRGVNDDAVVLENLFRTLTAMRIKPYYLHHPDLAPGTAHFRLPLRAGQEIVRQLQGKLSGMAHPRYMLDIPGGYGKVPVEGSWIKETAQGAVVRDYQGNHHAYDPDSSCKKD